MTTQLTQLTAGRAAEITFEEYGDGAPFLLLHGGAGPQSVTGFAQRLAGEGLGRVIVPVHPGFGGTPRPGWLASIGGLAECYTALLEALDLRDVTVIGNSIGGWIAAEMALLGSQRASRFILADAVGIVVAGQPIADVFQLSFEQLARLSYHNPDAFRINPAAMSDAQKAVMAANRQALAIYGGQPCTGDPGLVARLGGVRTPTLVLWGASDGVVTPDYGRAFAAAIPGARFELIADAGHLPHLETPGQVVSAIRDFVAVGLR